MAKISEETHSFLIKLIEFQNMVSEDREKIGWETDIVRPSFWNYDNVTVIDHLYSGNFVREYHVFLNEKLDKYCKRIVRKHGSVDDYFTESIDGDQESPYEALLSISECDFSSD